MKKHEKRETISKLSVRGLLEYEKHEKISIYRECSIEENEENQTDKSLLLNDVADNSTHSTAGTFVSSVISDTVDKLTTSMTNQFGGSLGIWVVSNVPLIFETTCTAYKHLGEGGIIK